MASPFDALQLPQFGVPTPQFPAPPTAQGHGGGMFGSASPLRGIAGAIGDMLMQRAGGSAMYGPMAQQRRLLDRQSQLSQQQQQSELQRQIALEQWKMQNDPTFGQGEQERMINTWNSLPDSDPRKSMYASALQHPVGMDVTAPDGSVTRQYVYPGSIPQTPTKPVGKLTPLGAGGPGLGAPGGFLGY